MTDGGTVATSGARGYLKPIDNPYWDEIKGYAKKSEWPYGGGLEVGAPNYTRGRDGKLDYNDVLGDMLKVNRHLFVTKYAWTITDPESVKFITRHERGGIVDPMAGTGYWAHLLGQEGVNVVCYDLLPGEESFYHAGAQSFAQIAQMDCAEATKLHPDRTLLLAWPPMDDSGYRAVAAYGGRRVIYIGESHGGCTGNDALFDLFNEQWTEVASHRPVQWWGIHDYITVYERSRPISKGE